MLLSICIPIYNTDIRPIATELYRQLQQFPSEVELLFLDDFSDIQIREKNRSVGLFCDYQELPENIGRSRIRNAFLPFVKGSYMLFLDGDSVVVRADFVAKYVAYIKEHKPDLVVGGREETMERPKRNFLLRWKYSQARESKTPEERTNDLTSGFKSNNFVVRKKIFEKNVFDESIQLYGHEDTLFGYQLRKKGVVCSHIDNPILNSDLVDNEEFLAKTKEAISNLLRIAIKLNDPQFIREQKLLTLVKRITRFKLTTYLFQSFGKIIQPLIYGLLIRGYVRLWLFDLYRLIELERLLAKDNLDE
ncbi:MAG: glycosyltransferase family 2 protein [Crocinitomicaceae bacterium]